MQLSGGNHPLVDGLAFRYMSSDSLQSHVGVVYDVLVVLTLLASIGTVYCSGVYATTHLDRLTYVSRRWLDEIPEGCG